MKLPDKELLLRLLRQRRNQILLGLFAFIVLVRIALPYVLRSVIVSQADAALVGRVELEDIDLSLIRGGVTLRGLSVHVDERPSTEPALFECKRVWTQISWLALLTKTIDVEEFELEGFVVRLDRLKDGMVLPRPIPSEAPEEPKPASTEPFGWSLAADSVAFLDGQIHFRDYTVGDEPQRFDLAVKDLSAQKLELRIDPTGAEPGRIVIEAKVGEGSVGLDSQVTQHPGGTGAVSRITLANLPIDKVRVYLKMFGWSDLSGKLHAVIEHRYEPDGANEIGGVASLSDVSVRVPGLDHPALGFEKLKVALDVVDLVKQNAAVSEVALVGARVVVDAKAKTPVLALAPRKSTKAVVEPELEPAKPTEPETPAKPWTWSVRKASVERAVVELQGGAEPLPLGIDAEVSSISSEPGARWPVKLKVAEGAGSLGVDGKLAIEPLAFDGKLTISELALQPLLSRIDAPAVGLVRQGKARADISIALATDLRVAGKLGVGGLDLGDEKTAKEFGVTWKDFELGIRDLSVSGVTGAGDPAKARSIGVQLDLVRLVEPSFKITRTPEGIVLPSFGSVAAETPQKEAAVPVAAQTEPERPATEILVEVASAAIEGARAVFSDRAVKPFFSTRIDRLDLRASGVKWPGPRVESLTLAVNGMNGARLDVRGAIIPGNSKLVAKLVKLPLAQFNPYVTPTGYGLADGTLSLESNATIKKDAYRTSTDVVVSRLDVGGSEGESLFQENFGIPLSVALGLLKDLDGNITLAIPLDGDRGGVKVGLGSIVVQALRSALVGALASPLKLLGVGSIGGKLQSVAPEPIVFAPGDVEPSLEGAARIEQIAGLLAGAPGISLTLIGGAAEADRRILRERALLTELEATSGLRALGQLGEIGTRRAVRGYLGAKLAGKAPAALDPEQDAWLEARVAEQVIDPGALDALASGRAAGVQALLVREHGIAEQRLTIGTSVTEPAASQPGVALALGAARKATPGG